MSLSVIIPTYNRPDSLPLCLEALTHQTLDHSQFEVLVVDDGSRYRADFIKQLKTNMRHHHFLWFNQAHHGQAAARNKGIYNAKNNILLFLGDDILATPNLLKIHLGWHIQNPQNNLCLIGPCNWHSCLRKTPFLNWLMISGMQNDYQHKPTYKQFYTGNLSIKKDFLLKNGLFDEDFDDQNHFFEDTELGYRLTKKGLKIIYSSQAQAFHLHQYKLDSFIKNRIMAGRRAASNY